MCLMCADTSGILLGLQTWKWNSIQQNLATLTSLQVVRFWVKIINFWELKILMKFSHFCPTREWTTRSKLFRIEFQREPIEKILFILSHFLIQKCVRGICTRQRYFLSFFRISTYRQSTIVESIFRGSGQKRNWLFRMKITNIWTILLKLRCWTFESLFLFSNPRGF